MKTKLDIQGMHCAACVERLTAAFGKVPGVRAARGAGKYAVTGISVPQEGTTTAAGGVGTHEHGTEAAAGEPRPSLYPLVLIVGFIAGIAGLATFVRGDGSWHTFMLDFMAGFFLVFSFFKLLDLRGFADAYATYDIVAKRSRAYAMVYPFIELALGVAYLVRWQPTVTNSVALGLMLVGSIGVLRAVLSRRAIRCACLGTALNLPMTTVTLVEDLGMAAMAAVALVSTH